MAQPSLVQSILCEVQAGHLENRGEPGTVFVRGEARIIVGACEFEKHRLWEIVGRNKRHNGFGFAGARLLGQGVTDYFHLLAVANWWYSLMASVPEEVKLVFIDHETNRRA